MTGETVTILRPGASTTTDIYGNDVPGPDTRTDVTGCAVAPRLQGDATEGGRQGVIIGTTVYFPAGTDVRATDRLEVRGEAHTIEGDPGYWTSPYSGTARGVEVATRRVEG
jgi:hypothetical protein